MFRFFKLFSLFIPILNKKENVTLTIFLRILTKLTHVHTHNKTNGIKKNHRKTKPFLNKKRIIIYKPKQKVMKATKKITVTEFKEMLEKWNFGAQPVSIQYVTEPKLIPEGKKRFGNVTKIANVGAMVGYVYENSVNNQLEREAKEREFIAKPLWKSAGKRISTALSTHVKKKTYYLTYKAQQTFKSFHFDSALNLIPMSVLKPFFPVNDPSKYQGTDEAIYHREILLENVRRFKFKGITLEIVPDNKI